MQAKDELRAGVSGLSDVRDQLRDVTSQQLGCNVLNCISDVNFSVASLIYNRLIEEFMMALDSCLITLVSTAFTLLLLCLRLPPPT